MPVRIHVRVKVSRKGQGYTRKGYTHKGKIYSVRVEVRVRVNVRVTCLYAV